MKDLADLLKFECELYDLDTVDGLAEGAFHDAFRKEMPFVKLLDEAGGERWKGSGLAALKAELSK